jgi:hypothetical protein
MLKAMYTPFFTSPVCSSSTPPTCRETTLLSNAGVGKSSKPQNPLFLIPSFRTRDVQQFGKTFVYDMIAVSCFVAVMLNYYMQRKWSQNLKMHPLFPEETE